MSLYKSIPVYTARPLISPKFSSRFPPNFPRGDRTAALWARYARYMALYGAIWRYMALYDSI